MKWISPITFADYLPDVLGDSGQMGLSSHHLVGLADKVDSTYADTSAKWAVATSGVHFTGGEGLAGSFVDTTGDLRASLVGAVRVVSAALSEFSRRLATFESSSHAVLKSEVAAFNALPPMEYSHADRDAAAEAGTYLPTLTRTSSERSRLVQRLILARATYTDMVDECAAGVNKAKGAAMLSLLQPGLLHYLSRVGSTGAALPQEDSEPLDPSTPREFDDHGFSLGPPLRPRIQWDEDFEYDSDTPTAADYASGAKWQAFLRGGQVLRWDLTDALAAYEHYWSNTGDPFVVDYEQAYRDDSGIVANVDDSIRIAQLSADGYAAGGLTSFSITGKARSTREYPKTENWQKAIGGHQQWTSADVEVSGQQVTMTVVVHAEDYYNFNRGQEDIATATPDDENGRFTEVGWAKPFETTGEVTRTVTWTLDDPTSVQVTVPPESEGTGR